MMENLEKLEFLKKMKNSPDDKKTEVLFDFLRKNKYLCSNKSKYQMNLFKK